MSINTPDGLQANSSCREKACPHLSPLACIAGLYVLVLLIFRETLRFVFYQDDYFFLGQLKSVPLSDRLLGSSIIPPYFRPLAADWLPTFNQWLWGANPAGFYLQLYLVVALLLYYIYRLADRLMGSAWYGCVAAALYLFSSIWPYNLGWPVTGNIELLSLLGYIASIYYFLSYVQEGKSFQRWAHLGFLFCGIASKEFAYGSICVCFLCWFLYTTERSFKNLLRFVGPSCTLCALWIGYTLFRYPAVWRNPDSRLSPVQAGITMVRALDSISPIELTTTWALIGGVVISFVIANFWRTHRAHAMRVLLLSLTVALLPALPIALVPYAAEYYATAPGVGVALTGAVFIAALTELCSKLGRFRAVALVGIGAVVICGIFLEGRRSVTRRPTLTTFATQPMTKRMLVSLDYWLNVPEYASGPVVLVGLNSHQEWALGRMHAFKYLHPYRSVQSVRTSEGIAPSADRLILYANAAGLLSPNKPRDDKEVAATAESLFKESRFAEALTEYAWLKAAQPENGHHEYYYAFCLQMTSRPNEALEAYTKALVLVPGLEAAVRYNRAAVLMNLGELDRAAEDLGRAQLLDPGNSGLSISWRRLNDLRAAKHPSSRR